MIQRSEGRYFIVRYMHDELRDEAANVGVILVTPGDGQATVRFLDDVVSKSRMDNRIDARLVEEFERWVHAEVGRLAGADVSDYAKAFESALREQTGNLIRISGPRTVLLNNAAEEIDLLFREWVAPRRSAGRVEGRVRDPLGGLRRLARSAIVRTLRESLSPPAARQMLKRDVEVAGQIHLNRFDAALVPSRRHNVRLFQHVLVLPEPEESYDQAAAVARRWLDVKAAEGPPCFMTAVLYSRENPGQAEMPDAIELLENDGIEIANLSGLPAIAAKLDQPRLFEDIPRSRKSSARR